MIFGAVFQFLLSEIFPGSSAAKNGLKLVGDAESGMTTLVSRHYMPTTFDHSKTNTSPTLVRSVDRVRYTIFFTCCDKILINLCKTHRMRCSVVSLISNSIDHNITMSFYLALVVLINCCVNLTIHFFVFLLCPIGGCHHVTVIPCIGIRPFHT